MEFLESSEQKEIRELVNKFAINEMRPKAAQYDHNKTFPKDVIEKAWELGLINMCIPAEYGGTGFSALDSTIITEGLAYGCLGMNSSMMSNDLALLPLVISDNQLLKKKYLPQFTENFKLASFCLTEPENGSDAAGLKTTLTDKGDNFVLNGQKMWITNAGFADIYVVYCTIDPLLKHKGITAVIVDAQTEGIELGKPEDKMGHRCSDTRALRFNNVKVPKENLLAPAGEGWKLAMKTLDHSRPMIASSAVGGAQAALDYSKNYAQERKQFGTEISNFQSIQFMIADMAMKIEAGRLLTRKAAWMCDENISNTQLASYAKAFASDSFMQIATDAVQIYGGYGYSREYPVEKLMRDAKLIQIYEGTSQIQRLVIAREIFSRS